MKRFFNILFSILFAAGITGLASYLYWKHINSPVKTVIIHISRQNENGFLNKAEIFNLISDKVEDTSVKIKDIDYLSIEETIKKNPWVKEADVYTDIEGNLIINLKEKQPVLRVFPTNTKDFYLDSDGSIIPLNPNYAPRVMIANGYIKAKIIPGHDNIYDTIYKDNQLRDLLYLTLTLNEYPFAEKLISEIYLNSQDEFDLVPVMGSNYIRFGDTSNAKSKLENMIVFYQKALKYEGWNKYKVLNLKYDNQIICTKN